MNKKFLIGGLLMLAAVVYLVFSAMGQGSQYFLTVEELLARQDEFQGRTLRVSGAVLGPSITYNPDTLELRFTIVHIPGDNKEIEAQGGLAAVLKAAVNDPTRPRLQVVYYGPKPDLLRHEAQAIVLGTLGDDGVFYAEELLLKCPTRYEAAVPTQASGGE